MIVTPQCKLTTKSMLSQCEGNDYIAEFSDCIIKNDFSRISQRFKYKSPSWAYEKEWRIFAPPGADLAANHGLELKAILYTPRFKKSSIKTLGLINKKYYKDKFQLGEIYPHPSKYRFIDSGDSKILETLLKENTNKKPRKQVEAAEN